jgi:hypothetical protein
MSGDIAAHFYIPKSVHNRDMIMKSSLQSQIITRRQTLSYIALGTAGIATGAAFARSSNSDVAATNNPSSLSNNETKSEIKPASPFVLSF